MTSTQGDPFEPSDALRAGLDAVAARAVWRYRDAELLSVLAVSTARVGGAGAGAAAGRRGGPAGIAADAGLPTTAAWLTANLHLQVGTAMSLVTSAHQLSQRPATAAALASDAVNADQALSQAHLDAVADQLNGRPRQTLGWKTPSQALGRRCADRLSPPALPGT